MILNTISSRDLLIDAYKFFSRGDARAHDAIRIINTRKDMTGAVLGCLAWASKEEEPEKRNLYIQAACIGKKFHPGIAIHEFPETCRLLRVMEFLRSQNIDTGLEGVDFGIEQLIARKQFSAALWIVKWLKIEGEQRILENWCEYLIQTRSISDEEVAMKIQEKLGLDPVVPYADIANKAIEYNRNTLAIKLIENEGQSLRKIPLLLTLKRYDLVLAQALATCDSNLIYMTIFKLKESMLSEIQFLELLKKHKLAFKYYCNFLAVTDISKLTMISYRDVSKDELTLYLLDNRLESALAAAKRTKQEFVAHQIEVRMRLGKFQQSLKMAPPPQAQTSDWVGLSISDTIINLISIGQSGKAKDCQRKFEVTDKKYKVLEQIALNTLPKLSIPTIPT